MPLFGLAAVSIVAMLLISWQEGRTAALVLLVWAVTAVYELGIVSTL